LVLLELLLVFGLIDLRASSATAGIGRADHERADYD
jgi:hypothetical protein